MLSLRRPLREGINQPCKKNFLPDPPEIARIIISGAYQKYTLSDKT